MAEKAFFLGFDRRHLLMGRTSNMTFLSALMNRHEKREAGLQIIWSHATESFLSDHWQLELNPETYCQPIQLTQQRCNIQIKRHLKLPILLYYKPAATSGLSGQLWVEYIAIIHQEVTKA